MPRSRLTTLLSGLLLCATVRADELSTESPFIPPSGGVAADPAATSQVGDFEFVGVLRSGAKTLFGFSKRDGKSLWLEEGGEKEGLAVLSRPDSDHVSVRIGGNVSQLRLKSPAAGPVPQFPPVRPPPVPQGNSYTQVPLQPPPPASQTQPHPPETETAAQEREARMLVSDLLEIGMQQRKAYEEAQKRRAGTRPGQQPPAPLPTVPPAN